MKTSIDRDEIKVMYRQYDLPDYGQQIISQYNPMHKKVITQLLNQRGRDKIDPLAKKILINRMTSSSFMSKKIDGDLSSLDLEYAIAVNNSSAVEFLLSVKTPITAKSLWCIFQNDNISILKQILKYPHLPVIPSTDILSLRKIISLDDQYTSIIPGHEKVYFSKYISHLFTTHPTIGNIIPIDIHKEEVDDISSIELPHLLVLINLYMILIKSNSGKILDWFYRNGLNIVTLYRLDKKYVKKNTGLDDHYPGLDIFLMAELKGWVLFKWIDKANERWFIPILTSYPNGSNFMWKILSLCSSYDIKILLKTLIDNARNRASCNSYIENVITYIHPYVPLKTWLSIMSKQDCDIDEYVDVYKLYSDNIDSDEYTRLLQKNTILDFSDIQMIISQI